MKRWAFSGVLLFSLVLSGCGGPTFGRHLVNDLVRTSDERMTFLLQNKEAYHSQDEWVKAINYTTWGYSSRWWESYSALDQAMRIRDFNIAKYLLEQGADPNGKPPMKFIDGLDLEYPIQRAVIKASSDEEALNWTKLLLRFGANPNLASRSYSPALQQAIKRHYPKTVRQLVNHGASTKMVTATDPPNISEFIRNKSKPLPRWYGALNSAVRYADENSETDRLIIKTLLEHGADFFDMSIPNSPSLAEYTRQEGKPRLAEYSIQAYADIQGLDARGLETLRQKIASYDLSVGKKKVERRLAEQSQNRQQVIDDSNAWASGGKSLIDRSVNQYYHAETRKLPNVNSSQLNQYRNAPEDEGVFRDCNADGIDDRKQKDFDFKTCAE